MSGSVDLNKYQVAVSGPDADKWIAAMGEDYQALVDNGTLEHVAAPTDHHFFNADAFKKLRERNWSDSQV